KDGFPKTSLPTVTRLMIPYLFSSLILVSYSLLIVPHAIAQTQEEYVTIWRESRNDFHSPDFPSDMFAGILNSSPPRAVQVQSGDTVSGMLQKLFNISQSWTPAVYDAVIAKVQDLNPSVDFKSLQPKTTLVLPQLPVTGKSSPGENALNTVPNLFAAKAGDT